MQVLKFGGSSVANAANMSKVVDIVRKALKEDKTLVVASAISGATDRLIEIGRLAEVANPKWETLVNELESRHYQIIDELLPHDFAVSAKETIGKLFAELKSICQGVSRVKELGLHTMDLIMSFGELCSTKILEAKFLSLGESCKWIDSRDIIKTYYALSQNIVDNDKTDAAAAAIAVTSAKLIVMPGFIASDESGRTTTLGRGGSDYTASILAASIGARRLEIWTDVCGMMTADPRIVSEAMTIEHISYREALELSHFGAKVVYPPTIQPAVRKSIPILVKNTFDPDGKGTLIERNPPHSQGIIKGISNCDKLAILSMEGSGMVGIPGYSSRLFDILSKNEINIILITQASSVHTMLVVIDEKDAARAKKAVDERFDYEIKLHKLEPLKVEKGYSLISIVGDDMNNQSGASGRMFRALGRAGVNIRAIAQGSSERNVSTIVPTSDIKAGIKAIHDEFFSAGKAPVNLFIAGYGVVGSELVNIIKADKSSNINVVGICNTRLSIIDKKGLNLDEAGAALKSAEGHINIIDFVDEVVNMNLPNTTFVDCTSDRVIAGLYVDLLSKGINVVTCNKIPNSMDMSFYKRLHKTAAANNAKYLYDTNVGAALPIIRTVKQMVGSGDKIDGIEAMVSGSLNYIFSEYCSEGCKDHFAEIVRRARVLGYCEPDPRTDLQGLDVARKAIILARESGAEIEPEDIVAERFLPESCLEGDVEHFFVEMEKNEPYFAGLRAKAFEAGAKLRYVASVNGSQVKVGLKSLASEHPFYSLNGTDSAVLISTALYPSPVLIKGAGAGGRITAGGVYSNILQCVNSL